MSKALEETSPDLNDRCNKADSMLLQDYLEGSIDPIDKIFVEGHLNACKACRRELSELKLMLWELGNRNNFEVEYPSDLDHLGQSLIDEVLGTEERSTARRVIDIQTNNIRLSSKFVEYLPGANQAPDMLKKASKGFAKGVSAGLKKGVSKGVRKMLEAR